MNPQNRPGRLSGLTYATAPSTPFHRRIVNIPLPSEKYRLKSWARLAFGCAMALVSVALFRQYGDAGALARISFAGMLLSGLILAGLCALRLRRRVDDAIPLSEADAVHLAKRLIEVGAVHVRYELANRERPVFYTELAGIEQSIRRELAASVGGSAPTANAT